jgi:hypothetical protein
LPDSRRTPPDPAGSRPVWPDQWLDPSKFGRILARSGRLLTMAGFRQSDIKCACKDEEFNFGKRFTVFKTVNLFSQIKESFTVKPKMIFIDHYFRPYQTP